MSVLIKGMKMPKTCAMCWLSPICPIWVKEVSRHKGYDNRLHDCPLAEVPTPHGRLIDADVFDRHMKQTPRYFSMCCDLEEQPTIIEAEEVDA